MNKWQNLHDHPGRHRISILQSLLPILNKWEIEKNFLNLIKGNTVKLTVIIVLHGKSINAFPVSLGKGKVIYFHHFYPALNWMF